MSNLVKLFSIKEDQILSGISPSVHLTKAGLWYKASGINPMVETSYESVNAGILQTGASPVDITSSVVVDTILGGVVDGNFLYNIGSSGHFYKKDFGDNNAPTDLRSGTPITNAQNGINVFQPAGGTKYLYYWQNAQIGRWDLAGTYATGWTDNQYTGLQSGTHPTWAFRGNVYYGNVDRIGALKDDGAGGVTHSTNVLDYNSDYSCNCLNDDGTYLIIAISSGSAYVPAKVLFWDTNLNGSWNREWKFPDPTVQSIQKYGNGFIAICGRGVYYFDFNTKPKWLFPASTGPVKAQGADVLKEGVLFGGNTTVSSFGKMSPADKAVYRIPFAGLTGVCSFVNASNGIERIFVATNTPKLYYILLTTGGQTGIIPETVYIPLGKQYQITTIEFLLAAPLASGDAMTPSLQGDETVAATAWPAMSFANHAAKNRVILQGASLVCDQVKMKLNFSAGNVKIKEINVYGKLHNPVG